MIHDDNRTLGISKHFRQLFRSDQEDKTERDAQAMTKTNDEGGFEKRQ